jgi:hypothetical protein
MPDPGTWQSGLSARRPMLSAAMANPSAALPDSRGWLIA